DYTEQWTADSREVLALLRQYRSLDPRDFSMPLDEGKVPLSMGHVVNGPCRQWAMSTMGHVDDSVATSLACFQDVFDWLDARADFPETEEARQRFDQSLQQLADLYWIARPAASASTRVRLGSYNFAPLLDSCDRSIHHIETDEDIHWVEIHKQRKWMIVHCVDEPPEMTELAND
ncbi:MAG: hypothetical protein HKN47_04960, partial [Pirellulaceae bacterium]|nr:hypothetical protein [Pirellulaceae bacterium]